MKPLEMSPLQQNFTDKLRYQMARTGKGTSEVAAFFGVKAPSVDGWLKTGRISKERLPGLASMFGTSLTYWMVESDPASEGSTPAPGAPPAVATAGGVAIWDRPEDLPPDEDRVWVDRWDYACSAGDGHIQWEISQKSALPFTRGFFQSIGSKPENCKLLTTRGDSMEPFLFNRDTIMVDISKTQIRDGAVYAVCFENEALVKRIYKEAGGIVVLNSFNSANYPDKIVDLAKVGQFEVIGEVVYRSGAGFASA